MTELRVKQSVVIALPASEIFAYIGDLANLPDWSGVIIAVRQISSTPLCVGATMLSTIQFLGKWLDILFEVVEYEPGCYLALKSISGGAPCFLCYHLVNAAEGSTTVSSEIAIHVVESILNLEESIIVNAVRRQIAYDLLTLKNFLENGVQACGVVN